MYRKKVHYSWQSAEGKKSPFFLVWKFRGIPSEFSFLTELHFSCHITCIGSWYSKGSCMNQHLCRVLQLKEFEVKVDLQTTKGVLEPWWTVQYVNYAYANHMKYTSYFFWTIPTGASPFCHPNLSTGLLVHYISWILRNVHHPILYLGMRNPSPVTVTTTMILTFFFARDHNLKPFVGGATSHGPYPLLLMEEILHHLVGIKQNLVNNRIFYISSG